MNTPDSGQLILPKGLFYVQAVKCVANGDKLPHYEFRLLLHRPTKIPKEYLDLHEIILQYVFHEWD